jgi:His/Glu/Gln/Arg/opine family amino acid ABC transporter permease subunit
MDRFLPILLEGALVSAKVTAGALVLATMLGLMLALFSLGKSRILYWLARSWIELVRGTRGLAQLFILYLGLADYGLQMPPLVAAIVGLGINGWPTRRNLPFGIWRLATVRRKRPLPRHAPYRRRAILRRPRLMVPPS